MPTMYSSGGGNVKNLYPEFGEGYIKYGNGLLICYGTTSISSNGYATINFPVAFATKDSYTLMASAMYVSGLTNSTSNTVTVQNNSASLAYVYMRDRSGAQLNDMYATYIAMGYWTDPESYDQSIN